MNTINNYSLILFIASFQFLSPTLFANEVTSKVSTEITKISDADIDTKIEKIEIRHARTSTMNKVFTQDNVLLLPENISCQQRTIVDYINQLAGVELNGQGGLKQSYNIRGFSRARIKTEIDGIPIITDRRAGNSASFLPPEFITSIYLQKGPSSTLYGSGAMGGVLSLSTTSNSLANVGMTYQPQDNSKQWHAIFTNDEITLGLLQRKASNSSAANEAQLNSQLKQSTATINYNKQWQNIELNASSIISQGKNIGKSSATFPQQRISLYPQDDHWLSQIKLSNAKDWQVQLFHHNQAWQSQVTRLSDTSSLENISRRNLTDYQATTIGGLGSIIISEFTLGFEWLGRRNIKISEQEFDKNLQPVWQQQATNANQDTYSAFIERSWDFNRLNLNFGVRYDQVKLEQKLSFKYEELDDNFISTAVSGNYVFNQHHQLSGEVATAFRFPSVSELFFSGETPRGNTQGNSELEPEESLGFQLNYRFKLNEQLSLLANSYFYLVDNYIERFQLNN